MNKRCLLLATRASTLSDGACRTLHEILLQMTDGGGVPSLTELSKARGRARSVMQEHMAEIVGAGILVETAELNTSDGNRHRYRFDQEALAKLNGFKCMDEVDYKAYLAEVSAGALIRAVAKGEVDHKELQTIPTLMKDKENMTAGDLLKRFREKYRSIFKTEYTSDPADRRKLTYLINKHSSAEVCDCIDYFFEQRHNLKPKKEISVLTLLNMFDTVRLRRLKK